MSDTQNPPEPQKNKAIQTLEDDVARILHGSSSGEPSSSSPVAPPPTSKSSPAPSTPLPPVPTPSRPPPGRPLPPPPRISFPSETSEVVPAPGSPIARPLTGPQMDKTAPFHATPPLSTRESGAPPTTSTVREGALGGIILPPPPPSSPPPRGYSVVPSPRQESPILVTSPPPLTQRGLAVKEQDTETVGKFGSRAPSIQGAPAAAGTGQGARPTWGEVELPEPEKPKPRPVFITPPPPPDTNDAERVSKQGAALGASFTPTPPTPTRPSSTEIRSTTPEPKKTDTERQIPAPLTNPFPSGSPPVADSEKKKNAPTISPIRTLSSDIAEVIQTNKTTLSSIALAENERKIARREELIQESSSRKNIVLILASILLIVGGIAVGYALLFHGKTEKPVVVAGRPEPLLRSEHGSEVSAAGKSTDILLRDLSTDLRSDIPVGSLKEVTVLGSTAPKSLMTLDELFERLDSGAPPELIRSFRKEYFLGSYGYRGSQPLLIARVGSFDVGYGGMLTWEKDVLFFFESLFAIRKSPPALVDGPSSRFGEYFEDGVVKNKDVRYVRDSLGDTLLVYSFIDNTTLVITTDEHVLGAIIERLHSARLTR